MKMIYNELPKTNKIGNALYMKIPSNVRKAK